MAVLPERRLCRCQVHRFALHAGAEALPLAGWHHCGPQFGREGDSLLKQDDKTQPGSSSHQEGYQLEDGYTSADWEGRDGTLYFAIDSIEVWTCPLQATDQK